MDYKLQGNDRYTPTIIEELAGSALLLFVISESYLASQRCNNELAGFLRSSVGDRRIGSAQRLFMVLSKKVDRSRLPEPLQDVIGYPFWMEELGRSPQFLVSQSRMRMTSCIGSA